MSMKRLALIALALTLPGLAAATDYSVQGAGSTLAFHGKFQGSGFDGHFEKFDAAIAYDPAHLDASKFDVTVDLASARTGDSDRDSALPGSDLFNVAQFPKAHFVTTAFHQDGGKVIANGNLTLHGVTKPVSLTVDFKPNGKNATLDVKGTVKRLDFGVGGGDYADTSVIANEVIVTAHLNLVSQ
jgi:polyisoprenoid-binding protein YceI